MSAFSFITKVFGGTTVSAEEQQKLFEELMFMTLSRAARSDLDVSSVEVSTIQTILKDAVGMDASEQEVRVASMSELYEEAPLERYVAKTAPSLTVEQRYVVLSSLYKLISVDGKVTLTEADFFDSVANALDLKPIEMMGAEIDQ